MELRDRAGEPIHLTPHDFRRIFSTTAVQDGLPLHIASKILGHRHLTSTEPYVAVFQDDLIRTYRTFVDNRRTGRPRRSTANPPTPNGKSSKNTSPCAGSNWAARPPLRLPLRTRTRLPALPRTESTRPTRPAGRDHHQPRRTHRRSRGAWLARGGRPADRHREGCPRQTRTPHPHRAVHGPRADSAAPPDHAGTAGRERGVTLGTRRCSVGKESFGVEGARAPGAGGGDGLTVGVVDQVPAGKDPVHGGAGRAALAGPHPK